MVGVAAVVGSLNFHRDGATFAQSGKHFLEHRIARGDISADASEVNIHKEPAPFDLVGDRRVVLSEAVLVVSGEEVVENARGGNTVVLRGIGSKVDEPVAEILGDGVFHAVIMDDRSVFQSHRGGEAGLLRPTGVSEHVGDGSDPTGGAL